MIRWRHALHLLVCLVVLGVGRATHAQQVERPIAFDTSGRVLVMTPMLAERLKLAPPVWTVSPGFTDARLYATGDSTRVVVVRRGEAVERYPLSLAEADALRRAVSAAAERSGMPVQADGTSSIDDPAGSRFVSSQTGLGFLLYGPLAAGLVSHDFNGGVYGVVAAGTFFVAQGIASANTVTAPMASLASDMAWRSAFFTLLMLGDSPLAQNRQTTLGLLLGSSIAGATGGFLAGRHYTLAEAEALGWGSTSTALLAVGLAGSLSNGSDLIRYATTAGLVAGLPIGLKYARNGSYALTAGDLYAMRVPQGLGAAWGGVVGELADASPKARLLLLTAGYAVGGVLGDRLLAKPYDLSVTNAGLLATGAGVSALAGLYIMSSSGATTALPYILVPTLSATLGTLLTASFLDLRPARRVGATSREASDTHDRVGAMLGRPKSSWRFDPSAVLSAAVRTPGQHAILSFTF